LEIKKIRNSISDFNQNEKVAYPVGSLGGIQETTFLTEFGLYKLLGRSNKPIAKHFQEWVYNVIKEIRITG
jgi:prophage antirepressor-like protein